MGREGHKGGIDQALRPQRDARTAKASRAAGEGLGAAPGIALMTGSRGLLGLQLDTVHGAVRSPAQPPLAQRGSPGAKVPGRGGFTVTTGVTPGGDVTV